jgi:penicillin-binding protein 1B
MALKIRFAGPGQGEGTRRGLGSILLRGALICVGVVTILVCLVGGYYYYRYQGIVDARLQQPLFETTAKIYAAPREVRPGQKLSISAIVNELRTAGYTAEGASKVSPLGTYTETTDSITVRPGPQSFHSQDGATFHFANGVVDSMSGDKGEALSSYELEPLLITGLSEGVNRGKRRVVTYDQLPRNLVMAVVSIEDRRFFEHSGVDYVRILGALRNDIIHKHTYMEGGSTLTMQAARGFFLTPEKKIKRKLIEIVITFQLEHRFTKQQIFQMYANQINLGQQGSFALNGLGEAAQA